MPRRFQFPWRSRRDISDDVDAELRFHLDSRADELVRAGRSPDAARTEALREFGNVGDARTYITRMDRRTEASRRRRDYIADFTQDCAYAVRKLRTAPTFALTAILTLALGVGANAAIFSVVNGVLLHPLPFPEPNQLVKVWSANRTAGSFHAGVSVLDVDDWRAQRKDIADIGAYFHIPAGSGIDLTGAGDPQRLSATFVTPGFFSTLGVHPELGRLPREEEMVRGGPDRVVVLSWAFWRRQFSGSRGVIDSTLTLGGESYRVLGVLPANVRFPSNVVDVYVPYSAIPDASIPHIRVVRVLDAFARLKPGVTLERAHAELNGIAAGLATQYSENAPWDATTVEPLHDAMTGGVRRSLLVLFGAVGFVLLIACVNVASLQLARATIRAREIAVRVALGAGRGRIIRQLVTENAVLSFAGGVAGLAIAVIGLRALLSLSAGQLPPGSDIRLNGVVIAFALGTSIVCGIVFGLAPALLSSRDVYQTLRAGGRGAGGGGHRLRHTLVVAEVALAMMLVIGGGLMTRSFVALMKEDPGFRPDHLLALNFSLSTSRNADFRQTYTRILEGTRALPGVVSAGAIKNAPFRGSGERNGFKLPGMVIPAGQDPPSAVLLHVSDGYFHTIGARIVEGREFAPSDRTGAPLVVLVNEAFARQWFAGKRATDQHLLLGNNTDVPVVGVVNDIRQVSMSQPAVPTIYIDNMQNGRVQMTLVVRTAGEPTSMASAVRQVVWSVDRLQPITSVFTFDDAMSDALARPRLLTVVLGAFGGLGLLLGALGLYGVLGYLVNQRQREIGVRLAIGARPVDVRRMIVARGLSLTAIGVAFGLAGAFVLSRFMSDVLYGVKPTDPMTFIVVSVTLLAVATLASWVPARRAASVDPAVTLRAE